MKFSNVLPLAALSSALVLPPAETFNQIAVEDHHQQSWVDEVVATSDEAFGEVQEQYEEAKDAVKNTWSSVTDYSHNAMDEAMSRASHVAQSARSSFDEAAFDAQAWAESAKDNLEDIVDGSDHGHGRRPHHPPHHHKPNLTVYQLIAGSKYTTTLAKLISEYDDLVEALNSTKANFTVFAPTDKAFAKIPEHAPKPSKEFLKMILSYHVVPDFYPAGRVLASHTVPTLLKSDRLGDRPQRLSFNIGLKGLTVNFYSRIIAINIFGTNGVIHGVDSIILPPPQVAKIIDLLPGEFSTLELALGKTGLYERLNSTHPHGGTLFAPSNFAFKKLGPKINAFLFSPYGQKYLKALLEYHIVPRRTLYSDAYYDESGADQNNVPKGYFHVDLPTLLEDRSLSIDVARYGGLIQIKVNAFSTVTVQDGVAYDGVIQVISDVLVPPKKVGGDSTAQAEGYWTGEEMSVEDLKERLAPLVAKKDL